MAHPGTPSRGAVVDAGFDGELPIVMGCKVVWLSVVCSVVITLLLFVKAVVLLPGRTVVRFEVVADWLLGMVLLPSRLVGDTEVVADWLLGVVLLSNRLVGGTEVIADWLLVVVLLPGRLVGNAEVAADSLLVEWIAVALVITV